MYVCLRNLDLSIAHFLSFLIHNTQACVASCCSTDRQTSHGKWPARLYASAKADSLSVHHSRVAHFSFVRGCASGARSFARLRFHATSRADHVKGNESIDTRNRPTLTNCRLRSLARQNLSSFLTDLSPRSSNIASHINILPWITTPIHHIRHGYANCCARCS